MPPSSRSARWEPRRASRSSAASCRRWPARIPSLHVVVQIVGIPIGGQSGPSFRPYFVGGIGLIRSSVQDVDEFFDVTTKNDFGFDVGGGVMAFFSSNIGIRGDIRYFRSFNGSSDNVTGLGVSDFNFWRGSVGVAFKF